MLVLNHEQDLGTQDPLIPTSPRPPKSSFSLDHVPCRQQNRRWAQHLLLGAWGGDERLSGMPGTTDIPNRIHSTLFPMCVYMAESSF